MEYPQEIYWDNFVPGISPTRQKTFLVERAYDMGKVDAKNLDGYSNLTAAISAGEPIDWEKLDGLKVQCVNPELRGEIHGTLKRNAEANVELSGAWRSRDMDEVYTAALWAGWNGKRGWTLWVEGEVPLRRKTADQLEPGYFFTGVLSGTTSESLMCVAGDHGIGKRVRYAFDFMPSHHPASKWEVIEEHGTFQKPEGK